MTAPTATPREAHASATTLVIAAMGGQGGGVLSSWIVDLAEHHGYLAQATSVPGVAQRTGATLYYVEIFPSAAADAAGKLPVLALMPTPGEVDIVLAAELAEAGRAVLRGIITPDRTTVIASSHREYSITEKSAMGDGIVDAAKIAEALAEAARSLILFDMAEVAATHETVISSVLFGALCGSGDLPFGRDDFAGAIRRSGVAPEASLRGFEAGYAAATDPPVGAPAGGAGPADQAAALTPAGETTNPKVQALLARAQAELPAAALPTAVEGMRRVADHQDLRAAHTFLDLLARVGKVDAGGPDAAHTLTLEAARHLALWMSYEDAIRVADLKIRPERHARVRDEVRAEEAQIVQVVEFLYPRIGEIAEILPTPLGRFILERPAIRRVLDRMISRGRKISTTKVSGFLLLSSIAALRRWRRHSYRYHLEMKAIDGWLEAVRLAAIHDYQFGVEVARCQTLVKGYGDTHANGCANFEAIMEVLPRITAQDENPAERIRTLRTAALEDEDGTLLGEALNALPVA